MPYAETVGAFKELQDEGKVRWIGLSNCNLEQLEEALGVAEIVSVQNQLSLGFTGPLGKGEVDACTRARDRVPALVAARRHRQRGRHAEVDPVARPPRRTTSRRSRSRWPGCSSLGPTVIPIPGASRPESVTDSAQAAELELSRDELDAITEAATS